MNIGVHVSFQISVFVSFQYIQRTGIAGSYGRSIFSFSRKLHTEGIFLQYLWHDEDLHWPRQHLKGAWVLWRHPAILHHLMGLIHELPWCRWVHLLSRSFRIQLSFPENSSSSSCILLLFLCPSRRPSCTGSKMTSLPLACSRPTFGVMRNAHVRLSIQRDDTLSQATACTLLPSQPLVLGLHRWIGHVSSLCPSNLRGHISSSLNGLLKVLILGLRLEDNITLPFHSQNGRGWRCGTAPTVSKETLSPISNSSWPSNYTLCILYIKV